MLGNQVGESLKSTIRNRMQAQLQWKKFQNLNFELKYPKKLETQEDLDLLEDVYLYERFFEDVRSKNGENALKEICAGDYPQELAEFKHQMKNQVLLDLYYLKLCGKKLFEEKVPDSPHFIKFRQRFFAQKAEKQRR